jgi:hypothetical protein
LSYENIFGTYFLYFIRDQEKSYRKDDDVVVISIFSLYDYDPEKLKDLFVFSDAAQASLDGCRTFKTGAT